MMSKQFSVVIPAYNESKRIGLVIERILEFNKDIDRKDIIVVDDGSTDQTAEVAESYGVTVMKNCKNLGKGNSVIKGIEASRNEFVVLIDGDGQHDPRHIPKLIEALDECDLVIGSRFLQKNEIPFERRFLNFVASEVISFFGRKRITDPLSGMRALRKSKFRFEKNDYRIDLEMVFYALRNDLKIREVPINVKYFPDRRSMLSITPRGIWEIIKIYSYLLFSSLGLVFSEKTRRFFVLLFVVILSFAFVVFSYFLFEYSNTLHLKILTGFLLLVSFPGLIFNSMTAYYYYRSSDYRLPAFSGRLQNKKKVAVVVTSYNENPALLKKTLTSLLTLDYPRELLRFYLLDDSTDEGIIREMERFCKEKDIKYLHRDKRDGYKGGAINAFVDKCEEDVVAIFDADEVLIDRSFLKELLPLFEDGKVAFVQTTKKYSNKNVFSTATDKTYSLFYDLVLPARSVERNAVFCGSCAIVRTSVLKQVKMPASVTEDVAFSLKVHELGYESIYVHKTYAIGEAIERFSSFCNQQYRYMYGNMEILKIYIRSLNRLNFSNAINYFMHIFSMLYISIVQIAIAFLSFVIAFSDIRVVSSLLYDTFVPVEFKIPQDAIGIMSIVLMYLSILLFSKLYFSSYRYGFFVFILNFAVAFVRAKAAIDSLMRKKVFFKTAREEESRSILHVFLKFAKAETLFSAMLLIGGLYAFSVSNYLGGFWLLWYSLLFGTTLLLAWFYR